MGMLGQTVELMGWDRYRGGLDVKTGTTGDHSVYTRYEDIEVMFHVSTMLPYTPDDIQQVERKRHLGNDVVLVVFCDGVTKFDPACISSQFITVIMVVEKQPFEVGKPTRYKIKFASKHGVKPV